MNTVWLLHLRQPDLLNLTHSNPSFSHLPLSFSSLLFSPAIPVFHTPSPNSSSLALFLSLSLSILLLHYSLLSLSCHTLVHLSTLNYLPFFERKRHNSAPVTFRNQAERWTLKGNFVSWVFLSVTNAESVSFGCHQGVRELLSVLFHCALDSRVVYLCTF